MSLCSGKNHGITLTRYTLFLISLFINIYCLEIVEMFRERREQYRLLTTGQPLCSRIV